MYHVDKWKVRREKSSTVSGYSYIIQSLGSGRPAIFRLEDVDCKHPEDSEPTVLRNGEKSVGCKSIWTSSIVGSSYIRRSQMEKRIL